MQKLDRLVPALSGVLEKGTEQCANVAWGM